MVNFSGVLLTLTFYRGQNIAASEQYKTFQ